MAAVSFPFELTDDLITLPVVVNGRDALRVVLDTGMICDGFLLFKTPKVDDLCLTFANRLMAGVDQLKAIPVKVSNGNVFDFPGLRLKNTSALVIDGNPYSSDLNIDGVVGCSLFSRYVVQLNFEKTLFRCWSRDESEVLDDYHSLPLTLRGGYPFIPCTVESANGDRIEIQAFVDLGANISVCLNADAHPELKIPVDAMEAGLSTTFGGAITGRIGQVNSMDLGGFILNDIDFVSCDGALGRCTHQVEIHEGSIGTGILNRFDVVIDYSNSRMLLKLSKRYANPRNLNNSGICVRKLKRGYYQIMQIAPASPAREAGLQVSDIITRVNGVPANQIRMSELDDIFDDSGVTFDLVVSRENILLKYLVTPRAPVQF